MAHVRRSGGKAERAAVHRGADTYTTGGLVEVEAPERVDDEAADVSGRRGSGSGSGVALCAA
eukprot:CAMPEP_0119182528 /NCGR_PEP_ID=MMETSP1315-20130426/62135_1 /TAXON_ID=676789 /ORGANISM="Prasinoderma singularis, Strain RCC927" /LENGTH=61 /DNA_ID=CAMNT_0007176877 /DNA_START=1 /DNA_END=184 /DNA_ORIENTATION=-